MKRHAPATARNSAPLAEVLSGELPDRGTVLEIASGSGEHAVFLARCFSHLVWQPSDLDPDALASIDAWASEAALPNLKRAIALDAAAPEWGVGPMEAILCVNMLHISSTASSAGILQGAAKTLRGDGPLIIYGPFFEAGVEPTQSNLDFDRSLRDRNGDWGLRRVEWLDALAAGDGLTRTARYEMPANNLVLVYRKD